MPTFGLTSSMSINSNEGVAMQLKKMGIEPKDLMAVVLSHLHHDHAGGLEDLIGAPTYMLEKHWQAFKNHIKATIEGAMPQHWPKNFAPKFLQVDGGSVASFEKSYPITSDGKVVAVETPGHVPGHLSMIIWGDNGNGYMLMGDATYSLAALEKEETDGINDDPFKAIETLRKIKELARQERIVILPAHEEDAVRRLREGVLYVPSIL
ncbi:putative N-acyl homoserine lactonase [Tricladium varicosporioides]|nr:putative N-acyl homoserine lactonase [Hymenoscyphus varicosporioides]